MKTSFASKSKPFYAAIIVVLIASLCGCKQSDAPNESSRTDTYDMGEKPWVLDIEEATIDNVNYRDVQWTGKYMQLVLMSLKPGEVIDLEVHSGHDQFIRIEQGEARVQMGESADNLSFDETVSDDWAILIPAGYWHTITNVGEDDLKLYTIYGPAEHASGLVHKTYADTEGYEH